MSEIEQRRALTEIVDRVRRMETRLTRFLQHQGFDTRASMPQYYPDNGVLVVPSLSASIKDCLMALPDDWDGHDELIVMHKGDVVIGLFKPLEEPKNVNK